MRGGSIRFGCASNSFLLCFETAPGPSGDFSYTSNLDSFLGSYTYIYREEDDIYIYVYARAGCGATYIMLHATVWTWDDIYVARGGVSRVYDVQVT